MNADAPSATTHLQWLGEQKSRMAAMREQIRVRLSDGENGSLLTASLAGAVDALLLRLLAHALAELPEADRKAAPELLAVVAVGGTGRGELAPYSDIDLLFLLTPEAAQHPALQGCIARIVRDCWDVGLKLGHSVRTLSDCFAMARSDREFATSLIEARWLWGNSRLTDQLQQRFWRKIIRPRIGAFIDECLAGRAKEFDEHGGTLRQLEPDVKKSAGGLRDLHLLRWVAYALFQATDLHVLQLQGVLTREDVQALQAAHEFMSRVRVDLHLAAGKPQDILSRDEQLRIATERGIEPTPGQRPVERFMQEYFRHGSNVIRIVRRFINRHRPRSWTRQIYRFLMTHRANQHFLVSGDEIDVRVSYRPTLCRSLEKLLQLYDLASLYRVQVNPLLQDAIEQAVPALPNISTAEEAELVVSIFRRGAHLGPVLRSWYETGLLEKVIPEFAHTRCLLQFNQYHSYTVDEHLLRAVEAVTAFERDQGSLGDVYREIHHKEVLHLAVLLHDIGKGYREDHSVLGKEIAERVTERLRLPQVLRDSVSFLVLKHLVMPDLAFRRNVADPEVYLPFSRDVGSPEMLRMLYVLSAADITAVGPGAWTNWKAGLVQSLFDRAMEVLSGESPRSREKEQRDRRHHQARSLFERRATEAGTEFDAAQFDRHFESLPTNYVLQNSAEDLADVVGCLQTLGDHDVIVRGSYCGQTHTVEYRIIARDHVGSGCFSKMAGALTAKRLNILSAEIATSAHGVILDCFRVIDYDYSGPVPDIRCEEVSDAIRDVLLGRKTVEGLFAQSRRYTDGNGVVALMPTRVVIDVDSSDRFSIVDIFAHDRPGLLYVITRTLMEEDVSVSLARIGSHLDQVVDVFYVTDALGQKLTNQTRINRLVTALESRIAAFEERGLACLS